MLASHGISAALWLQSTDFNSAENTRLLMIFIGILAVSVAVIALVVLVGAIMISRTVKQVIGVVDEVKGKSLPILASTQGVIGTVSRVAADLQPKIKSVTDDLAPRIRTISEDLQPKIRTVSTSFADMAEIGRRNAARADETLAKATQTAEDANQRLRAQVDRLDGMVSSALTATSNVAQTIHHSIRVPVNQVAGVMSGFKAGLDTLLGSGRDLSHTASTKAAGKSISLEGRREEQMERITERYTGSSREPGAVTMAVGDDILAGSSVSPTVAGTGADTRDNRAMAADVVASQRRAAEMRGAPDASDLAESSAKSRPVLPKRFQ